MVLEDDNGFIKLASNLDISRYLNKNRIKKAPLLILFYRHRIIQTNLSEIYSMYPLFIIPFYLFIWHSPRCLRKYNSVWMYSALTFCQTSIGLSLNMVEMTPMVCISSPSLSSLLSFSLPPTSRLWYNLGEWLYWPMARTRCFESSVKCSFQHSRY